MANRSDIKKLKEVILLRCSHDENFKKEFLANPKSTIEKVFDAKLSKELQVKAFEDTDTLIHFVVPSKAAIEIEKEIGEKELKAIVGGEGAGKEREWTREDYEWFREQAQREGSDISGFFM